MVYFIQKSDRLEIREESMFQSGSGGRKKPTSQLGSRNSLLGRASLFVPCWPSRDWVRPTHIKEDHLLYSVYSFKG